MSANVSMEDVERVAELANLDLAADERPRMQRDLNAILFRTERSMTLLRPLTNVTGVLISKWPTQT